MIIIIPKATTKKITQNYSKRNDNVIKIAYQKTSI